jgi:hypothetical protein
MTDLEHAAISRRLSLAIGWPESKLYSEGDGSFCSINVSDMPPIKIWRDFDYREFDVIWPIAERFNCFPNRVHSYGLWVAQYPGERFLFADTAALAVAMAVIKAKEKS